MPQALVKQYPPLEDTPAVALSNDQLFMEISRMIRFRHTENGIASTLDVQNREVRLALEQSYQRELELKTELAKRNIIS